ncbi:unnamed protein product [Ambrosiozyma monospora]|uniref:Unnamed protein product n=1 Tax=Ambrosiozyma monospora TaxID=43982 RepID=A0ACB5T4D9_AMBMO|nr:unnamed protein product [Ambrosiozyma monospora]
MTVSTKSQILAKFGTAAEDTEILTKCEELLSLFALSAEDLFLKWESFVYNTSLANGDLELTVENLNRLQEEIQKQLARQNQKTPSTHRAKRPILRNTPLGMSGIIPSTPLSSNKKRKLETPSSRHAAADISDISFNQQSSPATQETPSGSSKTAESGKVLETLNPQIPQSTSGKQTKLKLMANFNPHKYKFRTMNMKLLEVADYLDDQINTIARLVE